MENKPRRITITGNRGYIGAFLERVMRTGGHIVTGYDIRTIHSDDIRLKETQEVIARNSDVVIHLAALSGVAACKEYEIAMETNYVGTTDLALRCKELGVKRFIFASTSAVYGETRSFRLSEDHPKNPRNTYGSSKLYAEKILGNATDEFQVIILRKSNVYGMGLSCKGITVLDKFVESYLRKQPIMIVGSGTQKRDFLHIMDAVRLYAWLAVTPNRNSGVYNVGGGQCISIRELADMVNEIGRNVFGYTVDVTTSENVRDGFHDYVYDFERVRMEHLFKPAFTLDDYIKERMLMAMRE